MTSKGIPTRPSAKRLNKLPVIIVSVVTALIIAACFYVVTARQNKLKKTTQSNGMIDTVAINSNTPTPDFLGERYIQEIEEGQKRKQAKAGQGGGEINQVTDAALPDSGNSKMPKEALPEKTVSIQENKAKQFQPLYGRPAPPKSQKTDEQRFKEKIANQKRELAFKALTASTAVNITKTTSALTSSFQNQARSISPASQRQPVNRVINPSQKQDQELKNEFLDNAGEYKVSLINAYQEAKSAFELKQGHLIPMSLITKINSDLPGRIKAQVIENVYDTATGNHLIIPQGTMVNGIYDSRVVFGQKRVLVAWQRLIFPDGSSLNVGSMPGTDEEGTAGLEDLVDNHYFQVFGAAILMSIVNAGFTLATDTDDSSSDTESAQDAIAKSTATQMQQVFSTIIDKIMSIQPELIIRQGKEGHIILTKDVIGLRPYDPTDKPTYFLKTSQAY